MTLRSHLRLGLLVVLTGAAAALMAPAGVAQTDAAQAQSTGEVARKTANSYTNCPVNPATRRNDCSLETFNFDNSSSATGTSSQTGQHLMMNVTGVGVSLGNSGGWRVPIMNVEDFTVATRGIAQANNIMMYKHAVGDTMGHYDYIYSDGGATAQSDEAIKGYALDMGETSGYFHGTIASTTGTGDIQPALKFVSGRNWTTDGAPLLDIARGKIAGHLTGLSKPLAGSGYLNTLPVDNDLPLTTAWGICNDVIPNNKLPQTNTPVTCDVTLKQGRFKAGGLVCVTGPTYPEQAPITAAEEPANGSQSITIKVRNPNAKGANIFQGGVCGQYISFDANLAASGYRSSYYAFGALDSSHLIYGMLMRGNLAGNTLPMTGSEAEQAGVEGFNGYHLYPGCEVVENQTTGAKPVCEPNSVPWEQGDAIEAPHNVAVSMAGMAVDVLQNTPSNGGLSAGEMLVIHGYGAVGRTFIAHRTMNGNPYTLFKPFGGQLAAPDLDRIEGYFANGMVFNAAPGAVVRVVGNADHSQAPITLFALPGGEIKWDPATGTLLTTNISANLVGTGTRGGAAPAAAPALRALRGTTGPIGGAPLGMGTCATGTASIQGATPSMVPVTVASATGAPGFSPNGAFQVSAQVTAANTVTVSVCAVIAGTPRPSTYVVALE